MQSENYLCWKRWDMDFYFDFRHWNIHHG